MVLVALLVCLPSCYYLQSSSGGGQTDFKPPREIAPSDIALPEGYRIEAVARGLTFPTGVAFDETGAVYVVEAGYSYGEVWTTPRLLRVNPEKGTFSAVASGGKNGPWTGADFYKGNFYIAEGGELEGGRIVRVTKDGDLKRLISDLPSMGDHHTNGVAVGPDGWLYFAVGTATNSGVVGVDNYHFGWLKRYPRFHDIPCRDVILSGENYETQNPFEPGKEETVTTGAFVPFGVSTTKGQVVKGAIPCSGAVFRMRPEGGSLDLVAWGFRNPFGLAFSPDGKLYVTENQYDIRGSRPVYGAGDLFREVVRGKWHGWPDFHGSDPLARDERYKPPLKDEVRLVLHQPPNVPPAPVAVLGVHSSSNGFDFSRNPDFGYTGHAFIAQFGDQAPTTGKVLAPVGFKVVRVDPETGVVADFAINKGEAGGPASWTGGGGLERPVAARFDPKGRALYVVDFGVMMQREEGAIPIPETGVLWRIVPGGEGAKIPLNEGIIHRHASG
jgi:glucose/arabinose dehydrogenase